MGFWRRFFSSRKTRAHLIRDLLTQRVLGDPAVQGHITPGMISEMSEMELMMSPEAAIVTNVETYLVMKGQGASDAEIFSYIEDHRSSLGSGEPPENCGLLEFVRYRVGIENPGLPIADRFIEEAVHASLDFFRS